MGINCYRKVPGSIPGRGRQFFCLSSHFFVSLLIFLSFGDKILFTELEHLLQCIWDDLGILSLSFSKYLT